MYIIALKNLLQERVRLIITLIGISFSISLMLLLISIYDGVKYQYVSFLRSVPAEIVITKNGVKDMYHAASIIPQETKESIWNIEGVNEVQGIVMLNAAYETKDTKTDLMLSSYLPTSDIGAPNNIVEGRHIKDIDEIILDKSFARRNNLKLDSYIQLGENEFRIVGYSDGISSLLISYAFIHKETAEELLGVENISNYVFVKVKDGYNVEDVKNDINDSLNSQFIALRKEELMETSLDEIETTFLPIIGGIVFVGILVGISVVGITTYSTTVDKAKEYGVLKAIGTTNIQLYILVLFQSLFSILLGFLISIILTLISAKIMELAIINLEIKFTLGKILSVFILNVLMGIVATFFPARRIANIDPAEVFKS